MSLVFGFNHRACLILLHCDTLITMISTSGTYAFVVLKLHGSKMELAGQKKKVENVRERVTKLQKKK